MLFLITKKQKDKILNEYYASLINVVTLTIVCLFIIFVIFLLPSYLMMKVDKQILTDKITPLQNQIDLYKVQTEKNNITGINDDISILNLKTKDEAVSIYEEINSIYKEVPNVKISSLDIDILNKQIIVVANVGSKDDAILLVDKLNSSKYKGADLPYSVFSQNKNFTFSQTLNYE